MKLCCELASNQCVYGTVNAKMGRVILHTVMPFIALELTSHNFSFAIPISVASSSRINFYSVHLSRVSVQSEGFLTGRNGVTLIMSIFEAFTLGNYLSIWQFLLQTWDTNHPSVTDPSVQSSAVQQ